MLSIDLFQHLVSHVSTTEIITVAKMKHNFAFVSVLFHM